ncbi:CheR family methyltransferase [Pyxidicoccus xibeiensis]|uniref:CheR family methyltransferase n=1 Tax=Pyxidicoccus xibeiensis TaxID=2906759 RepID=UPI0020A70A2D|nr:CheR family methyltransferase [Pyxidicoccus xibeiensis]MCP3139083.1 hypothetical protein [Pyxidicoccus xibeiensis]
MLRNIRIGPRPTELGTFDLVLCRNVLIYFDAVSTQRVVRGLEQHLAADGLLLLGHVEGMHGARGALRAVHPSTYARRPAPPARRP